MIPWGFLILAFVVGIVLGFASAAFCNAAHDSDYRDIEQFRGRKGTGA